MARFCQSCGVLLPTVTNQTLGRASQPYYNYPQKQGMSSGEKTAIIVVVLIVILLLGGVAATYLYYSPIISRTSFGRGSVTVTNVFLVIIYPGNSLRNNTSGYFGNTYQSISNTETLPQNEIFTVSFTLYNRDNTPHYVNSLTLAYSPGFSLLSTNPSPSRTVQAGASMTFTVTLQAPNNSYVGVVNLDLFTQ